MSSNKKILILPGDGIGVEVMNEVLNIIDWMAKNKSVSFDTSERLVGGAAYEQEGDSISDTTMEEALQADAVLFGAVGGPKWDDPYANVRPEDGILAIRKCMGLFANLRPVKVLPALANASPIKSELLSGVDMMIVRELIGGLYFDGQRNDGLRKQDAVV